MTTATEEKVHDVQAELIRELNIKRAKKETTERWIERLLKGADKLDDEVYDNLSGAAQTWVYHGTKALNNGRELPYPPGLVETVDEPEKPKGKSKKLVKVDEPTEVASATDLVVVETESVAEVVDVADADEAAPPSNGAATVGVLVPVKRKKSTRKREVNVGKEIAKIVLGDPEVTTAQVTSLLADKGVVVNNWTVQCNVSSAKRVVRVAKEIGWTP